MRIFPREVSPLLQWLRMMTVSWLIEKDFEAADFDLEELSILFFSMSFLLISGLLLIFRNSNNLNFPSQ
jgi:hypothetical protein